MGRITNSAVLALTVLLAMLAGHAATQSALNAVAESSNMQSALPDPVPDPAASVPLPEAEKAVVVTAGLASNSRGWVPAGDVAIVRGDQSVRAELVDAYSLAVLLAPDSCHLSLSLLAAIGQVESGNLSGHVIDARNRAVPGVLGPVLDGTGTAAVPDSDNGVWDGHKVWDRALGPMQLLPVTWREVGLDADGDGVRDPQNIYDSAAAAMVYLCAAGGDLGTPAGLEEAVWSYNHSRSYVRLVLSWKTAFDAADITGVSWDPTPGTWQMGADPFEPTMPADGAQALQLRQSAQTLTQPSPSVTALRSPTASPTAVPTARPSERPSASPSAVLSPTAQAPSSGAPSVTPAEEPTCPTPTETPTEIPTEIPTETPNGNPAPAPSGTPTDIAAIVADPCAPAGPTGSASPAPEPTAHQTATGPAAPTGTPTAR